MNGISITREFREKSGKASVKGEIVLVIIVILPKKTNVKKLIDKDK